MKSLGKAGFQENSDYKVKIVITIWVQMICAGWKVERAFFLFISTGIRFMQGLTDTTTHEVTRKRSTKRISYIRNLFRKNLQIKRCL